MSSDWEEGDPVYGAVPRLRPLPERFDEAVRGNFTNVIERVVGDERPIVGYLVVILRSDGSMTFDHTTGTDVALIGAVTCAHHSLIANHIQKNSR